MGTLDGTYDKSQRRKMWGIMSKRRRSCLTGARKSWKKEATQVEEYGDVIEAERGVDSLVGGLPVGVWRVSVAGTRHRKALKPPASGNERVILVSTIARRRSDSRSSSSIRWSIRELMVFVAFESASRRRASSEFIATLDSRSSVMVFSAHATRSSRSFSTALPRELEL